MKLRFSYWAKSRGIWGKIKSPDDFVVREVLHPKFFKRFVRGEKIKKTDGKYVLFLLKKKNITTKEAIGRIAFSLNSKEEDFSYAGLKDKFSISYQYITAKDINEKKLKKFGIGDVKILDIRKTDKRISLGDLLGNEFKIVLHNCRNKNNLEKIVKEIHKRGVPNYFGLQRFGNNGNNHIIGKYIIKRNFSSALKLINRNSKRRYGKMKEIPKGLIKFFIHAYQSWIFNEVLNGYIKKYDQPYYKEINVIGYDTKLGRSKLDGIIKNIIRKEGITKDYFKINELRIGCSGSKRKLFISSEVNYKINKNVKLEFFLPKGSYGTILLREIIR